MTTATATRKPWWHPGRLRISVRTLILLVLIAGGGLGWFVDSARVQRRAVAAIEAAGGNVGYDWAILGGNLNAKTNQASHWKRVVDAIGVDYVGNVTRVRIHGGAKVGIVTDEVMVEVGRLTSLEDLQVYDWQPLVTDAGLARIRNLTRLKGLSLVFDTEPKVDLSIVEGLTRLERLQLSFFPVSDADLAHVSGLTRLKDLEICVNPQAAGPVPLAGDAGMAYLTPLRDLERLQLDGLRVTSAGLVHLKGMGRLRDLNLNSTRVADLSPLKDLAGLESLTLYRTPMTDAGLAPAGSFARLKSLNLQGSQVGDPGLVRLMSCPRLGQLTLRDTKLTDLGMAQLAAKPSLVNLDVGQTRVTPAGLAKAARPGLTIEP